MTQGIGGNGSRNCDASRRMQEENSTTNKAARDAVVKASLCRTPRRSPGLGRNFCATRIGLPDRLKGGTEGGFGS
jgi:hypothetical protein